ncbi:MAG TPA: class I SAM-dependent methyltransferase [Nannocystaceae bacterium]|nr:class I SAM-dependent methyltransferase [Nannocystaceae bacterium]
MSIAANWHHPETALGRADRFPRPSDRWNAIADELFDDTFCEAVELQNQYCDLLLQRLWLDLDLGRRLTRPKTAAELAAELDFVASADVTLDAMLRRLSRRVGIVQVVAGAPLRFVARDVPADPTAALALARESMADLGDEWPTALELMDFGADHFVLALRDDPEFMDRILSGREPEHADMWHRATNADPLQDIHGRLGGRVLDELFDGGTIVEIGGGTGNGIRNFFASLELHDRLDAVDKYVFTDISNRFLMGTRKEISRRWPGVTTDWKFLDINDPMGDAKIPAGDIDVIYGVNAAHVAKDIVGFLRSCRDVLRPGGRVAFSERIRWIPDGMAPRELALNLSIYHRTAAEKSLARPLHCYLHPEGWRRVLVDAGLTEIEIIPDLEHMAGRMREPYAAVVTAVKR